MCVGSVLVGHGFQDPGQSVCDATESVDRRTVIPRRKSSRVQEGLVHSGCDANDGKNGRGCE